MSLVRRFEAMSQQEIEAYFRETEAVEITSDLAAADDATLIGVLADDRVREQAVHAILERFEEFADPKRLREISGVITFDLARKGAANERHTVHLEHGDVTLIDDRHDLAHSEVTIRASMVDFVRLVTGQKNAALMYLAGDLSVEGEAMLALAVGTVFTVPGSDRVAVDPTALDPVDVATAVASSSTQHMREVMSGGFRPVVLGEVVRRFPEFLDPKKSAAMRLRVGFKIGGRADGGSDRFLVHVDRGACWIDSTPAEGVPRDATISVDGVGFLRLATGQMNPVKGVLTGALKVRGDRGKALALNGAMNPPQPRPH